MANFLKTFFGKDGKDNNSQLRTVPGSKNTNQSEKISEIIILAETLTGAWPKELSRDTFKNNDLDKLTARLLDYIKSSYRGQPADITEFPSKPEYEVVAGKVGRVGNPVQDIKIVQTATLLAGSNVNTQDLDQMVEQYGRLAFKVIEYYAQTTLAKFLFHLPTASRSCKAHAHGKKAIIVEEYERIGVYKGVENVLLELWDELGEGGHIDDMTVTRKFLSIVEASKL
ncbi:MAG: hypothetical protein WA081_11495 [Desulfosalsimonadaceae bacterium]